MLLCLHPLQRLQLRSFREGPGIGDAYRIQQLQPHPAKLPPPVMQNTFSPCRSVTGQLLQMAPYASSDAPCSSQDSPPARHTVTGWSWEA